MSSQGRFLTLLVFFSCLFAVGCGTQLVKSLGELARLQAEIVKEYGEEGVNVRVNNSTTLVVTFINSPLNVKSREARSKRAQQTATFVKMHYPSIQKIEEVWVSFIRQETRYVLVHYTEGLDYFGFDKNARPLRVFEEDSSASASENSFRPVALYSPKLKRTDISIARLQLQGDLDEGLALAPHFTLSGDATGVKLSPGPRFVSFDFASYAPTSMFPGETQIAFLTDEKVLFETKGVFSKSKLADGTAVEFLYLQLPYQTFRQMTAHKNFTIRLGSIDYKLTNEQVAGLREMTRYVKK